ncbi:SMC-Scp complex subunit ScpB [Adlercreutzia faecimuris]|uniref:SMC-Scp complex subunit ScpB n=1 Tax=Adlercreutzia faecimuris TaxID=2897341 RepID=A0ABS9WIT8_9ACTN|nr:SMC-Scp complex subunit ScpB [Adlercreutzia sp. JBNU-10]MCI2242690.1 SMC-Scp complex subunit ScpB [Adlercreutzia sp. JBNU-10]
MFQGLQEAQVKGAVEAMLFVTDEPVGVIALADMLECDPALVERACHELRDDLAAREGGIQLREVAGGWRLFTHPAYHELIERYVLSWDTRKLSGAAMETLAIIAYTQPVTRAGIASVRGVSSDSAVNSLVEKGLVREAGTADTPGNPTLYATTRAFLEKFGLRSPADLPDLAEFAPDEETRRLITERLSATRSEAGVTDEQARLMAADLAEGDEEAFLFEEEALLGPDAAAATLGAVAAGGAVALAEGAAVAAWAPAEPDAPAGARSAEAMFAEAIASTLGVVDKIDFDALTFETDDE